MSPTELAPSETTDDAALLARIERRAVALWTRRRLVAVTATAAVVVAAVLPTLSARDDPPERVAAGGDGEVGAASSVPSTAARTLETSPTPAVPPTVAPSPSAGPQASTSGTSGGLTVTFDAGTATPGTGDEVSFSIHVTDDAAEHHTEGVDYGDGMAEPLNEVECPQDGGRAQPLDLTVERTHVFVDPEPVDVKATVRTGGCEVQRDEVTLTLTLTVGGAPLARTDARQGGLLVEIFATDVSPAPGEVVRFVGRARDDVGTMTSWRWMGIPYGGWAADIACPDPPEADRPGSHQEHHDHAFDARGTYTVSVDVESTGCRTGIDRTTATLRIDVG